MNSWNRPIEWFSRLWQEFSLALLFRFDWIHFGCGRQKKKKPYKYSPWDPAGIQTTFHLVHLVNFYNVESQTMNRRGAKVVLSAHPLHEFMLNAVMSETSRVGHGEPVSAAPSSQETARLEDDTGHCCCLLQNINMDETLNLPCLTVGTSSFLHFSMLIYVVTKKETQSILHYSLSLEYILVFF